MARDLACALYCNPNGSLNILGTVMAWFLGIPFGLALLVGVARVFAGGGNKRRR